MLNKKQQETKEDSVVRVQTNVGNTIKYEEFIKLPDGVISSGIISDSKDGINIDNSKELLMYIVYKYSNQDWAVYCLRYNTVKDMYLEDAYKFIKNTGIKLTIAQNIKRVFNCSKKVLDLYTY